MRRYALSRGAPKESAEEFGAYAWEMLYVRNWKATWHQLFSDFTRNNLKAVRLQSEKGEDFVERRVGSPQISQDFSGLVDREKMVAILLQAGFSIDRIEKAFRKRDLSTEMRGCRALKDRKEDTSKKAWSREVFDRLNRTS